MGHVNLLPGIVSPADLRGLRELVESFGLGVTILPDYSRTLDGATWTEYHRIPQGGTPLDQIRQAGRAVASIELSSVLDPAISAGAYLHERFRVPRLVLGLPIGVQACDSFVATLERLTGRRLGDKHEAARGRLLDSYVDGHKYVAGKRVAVIGEDDLVAALAGLLTEIGMSVVLCVSGGRTGRLAQALASHGGASAPAVVLEDSDYAAAQEAAKGLDVDLLVGNSNAYRLARDLGCPLVRVGLPIHDRLGGGRILTVGYEGTQQLYDRLVNAVLQAAQDESAIGYTHW
jgi:nitrogenase molybdenum-iron protein NifN